MKAQELLDIADREGSVEVAGDIWIYTKSAIIEENGSEFTEPNPDEEGEINLLTAPYWWVEIGMGSWTYPIHTTEDIQRHLDSLVK
ncbi:hypothetical protein [Acinetobacter sp. CAAS 2-6]|uniref:hypothetical protein n=1 Tax=Acinetobacter sp. CAAS 2-6 TaxID=3016358 RepID=UPI002DD633FE|nr:hypothetical protein [Acinetobacter sp. CAAS 2-6]